ncbi:hypothetical protein GCM10010954_10790 [Halobacillus andaensis]|uniref:Zincin peptidase n=1 Tax=Halobacillus andaensis TaxID=1176239 RepID=A0A917B131_HALAA|nr:DUF3267 domain-containing protein [Halobacillus andaensis]MBP2003870.1 hypothetical protein [Halobacillus andaensis]GGF13875.1 hypothetical protein GCM10010954_10790 [Halobacillus andaensis]
MKLTTKLPEFNEQHHQQLIEKGWTPLKEPKKLITSILLSIPFMIINVIIAIGVIHFSAGIYFRDFGIDSSSFTITINLMSLVLFFVLLIIHEGIHLIFVPNFKKSDRTFVGVNWLVGFVYTEQSMTKRRFLLIALAPFLILSIVLPFILGALGLLTSTFKLLIIINAAASSVDLLSSSLVGIQVPNQARMINNGVRSYWKKDEEAGSHTKSIG